MSLKQRATKCSGYIPPSQYVPVYSRPHRTSNVRWHEELSPITPKPSFDDPDSTRSRSIEQAVKAWLDSSPKSVIGIRGRSPTDSPRTSLSSPDQAVATTPDGELDQTFGDVASESPTFQKNKLTPWKDIVGKGGSAQSKADDHILAQNKITGGDQTTTEEISAVQEKESTALQEVFVPVAGSSYSDLDTDNYSQAIMEALKSSPIVPESHLKPPRVLEKAIMLYGGEREERLPYNEETIDRCGGNIHEIRGKELEDFPARKYEERRLRGFGANVLKTTAMNNGGDNSALDSESVDGEANDMCGFISSAVSSPISVYEERRFGGEGMNLIQIAGSGEFSAESMSHKGISQVKPGIDSSHVTHDFDSGAENKRPTRYIQSRRTNQPLYRKVSTHSAHSPMSTGQEDRHEAQSRPVSGLTAQYANGGKRDGPTKTAAVVPVPEDSQCTTNSIQEEKPSTPLEGVDSNQVRWTKQPFNRQETLERVRKEKFSTKAAAWEEAKSSQCLNRYRREETKIMAWEDHKKAQAEMNLKKVELKLQEKRAKAIERMENEVARAHKKAAEKKAIAEAKRAEKAARATEEAEIIRQRGRRSLSLFCFSP